MRTREKTFRTVNGITRFTNEVGINYASSRVLRDFYDVVVEPFGNTQTKLILNLVNNFIRDWSEKRSGSRPCLRICRFCDRVVNETTRQWVCNNFNI